MSDISSQNFTVYRSSAGSGKTYTLVKEYLKIILAEPAKFRNILAVTFTNKAAREMKDRILRNLHEISECKEDSSNEKIKNLLEILAEETKLTHEVIISNAGEAISLILHNYADFSISTIDSFVHRVIRSFALELDLSMNFEVEMDTDELTSKCVDLLLDEAGNNEELTKVLLKFIQYKSSQDLNLNIETDLNKFAKNLGKEVLQTYLDDFRKVTPEDFNKVSIKTSEFIRQFENYISNIAVEVRETITDKGINDNSFFQGKNGIGGYFRNLSENKFDKIIPNSFVQKTISEDKWTSGKASQAEKHKIEGIRENLKSAYNKIDEKIALDHSRYITYKLLNRNIYQLAVLNLIENIIDKFKKENNLLLISEFNKKISEIVFSEPVPFIYERLGERYNHYFIDEFQDTSVLQWMNLLPLIDNSLAEAKFNMVVGDGKQAIYRFRNGEVEQFVQLPSLSDKMKNPVNAEREKSLERNYLERSLEKNYRSRQNIIKFNNDLFSYIAEKVLPEGWKDVYKNPTQIINENKPGGFVSIDFPLNEKDGEISFADIVNKRILEIVNKQFDLGYDHKDIAILCRTRKSLGKIANYLTKQGIQVVSSESLLLAGSPSVNFIIACMKILSCPDDGILLEEIKRFLSDNNLQKRVAVKELDLTNRSTLSYLSKFPVYDLCEHLISSFALNNEMDPYIHYFLDLVFEYTSKYNPNIFDFLEWWEDQKEKSFVIIPEETNAVRMMTIHKAKGLEFPVVIYPYANQTLKTSEDYLWIDNEDENIRELPFLMLPVIKELKETEYAKYYDSEEAKSFLDMINLLYVVMTRAEDNLYVISEKPRDKRSDGNSETRKVHHILHDFLLQSGLMPEDEINYTLGDETRKPATSDLKSQKSCIIEKPISRDWREHAVISKRAPEIWDIDDPDRNRKWGNLVHTILSKIRYYDDKDAVLNRFYFEGYIDKEEKKSLNEKIEQILNNQYVKPFFENDLIIKTEAEILLPDGSSYRPDRVVLDGKRAVVIDYKTGKSSEYHKKQLDNYASLLQDMGYEVDKKYLIYIDDEVDVVQV